MEVEVEILVLGDVDDDVVGALVRRCGLCLCPVSAGRPIPGTYWGEPEAGLVGSNLHARDDTPLHSVLHEACHFVCMDANRRSGLERDAGGDDAEENAVCYLQVLLADQVPGLGRERMFRDMDAWGYSFRLGGSRRWFEEDAEDARLWLFDQGVIDEAARPLWRKRI